MEILLLCLLAAVALSHTAAFRLLKGLAFVALAGLALAAVVWLLGVVLPLPGWGIALGAVGFIALLWLDANQREPEEQENIRRLRAGLPPTPGSLAEWRAKHGWKPRRI